MKIVNRIKNAFTGGEWFLAYRTKDDTKWKEIETPDNQWCADPFVFEDGDNHYIFVEQYLKEKDKGCIGYYKFINGKPVNQGIVIENKYHMSYPDVFKYKTQYYMIPESSANSTIDIYVADHFPDKWRKDKTLISGKKYVDSTVIKNETGYYLISYTVNDGYEIHVFSLDMEKKELSRVSGKLYGANIARPGGRLFYENGVLLRPAQDCSKKYGEMLIIYQVDALNDNGEYKEHEIGRIKASEISVDKCPERIHQLTKDTEFEVIDLFKEKIDLLHAIKIYLRSKRK